jgi:methenyltetrahydromethanopterin cyclohydrolase
LAIQKQPRVLVSVPKFSLNKSALKLVRKVMEDPDKYGVSVETSDCGATLIDAGINSRGGFLAGRIVTEICMAGYGKANIMPIQYRDMVLLSMFVTTDFPVLSTLGSQFTGWQLKSDEFSAAASGPARALAMEPGDLFRKLQYKEESEVAVIVLETDKIPPKATINQIADRCSVSSKNLFLILFSSNSVTGGIQACGRVVEIGLRKLVEVGLDPLIVRHAWGYAPIVATHLSPSEATERAYGAIRSCGVTNYLVECVDEQSLPIMVSQTSASALKMIQEARRLAENNPRYKDIFKDTGINLLKVETNTLAPAVVTVSNLKTGKSFSSGEFDLESIKRYLGTV